MPKCQLALIKTNLRNKKKIRHFDGGGDKNDYYKTERNRVDTVQTPTHDRQARPKHIGK